MILGCGEESHLNLFYSVMNRDKKYIFILKIELLTEVEGKR